MKICTKKSLKQIRFSNWFMRHIQFLILHFTSQKNAEFRNFKKVGLCRPMPPVWGKRDYIYFRKWRLLYWQRIRCLRKTKQIYYFVSFSNFARKDFEKKPVGISFSTVTNRKCMWQRTFQNQVQYSIWRQVFFQSVMNRFDLLMDV
jgi:hypothetical protein